MDLEDDAQFQCQIGAADGVKPIRSRYATLTVLVPPEPPKLMPTGDLFRTVEGRQVELRCESRGGKPASEVSYNGLDTVCNTITWLISANYRKRSCLSSSFMTHDLI